MKSTNQTECVFCKIGQKSEEFISETKSFTVLKNIFPYSVWDSQGVTDHLMVVPKQHTDTVSDFSPEVAKEFVNILGSYESKGYNVYARAPSSNMKTIPHQHTHLIKTSGISQKLIFLIRWPLYFRIPR